MLQAPLPMSLPLASPLGHRQKTHKHEVEGSGVGEWWESESQNKETMGKGPQSEKGCTGRQKKVREEKVEGVEGGEKGSYPWIPFSHSSNRLGTLLQSHKPQQNHVFVKKYGNPWGYMLMSMQPLGK